MTVSSNLSTFLNKRVQTYVPGSEIVNPETVVYRISVEYDEETPIESKLDEFAASPVAGQIKELIIGQFVTDYGESSQTLVEKLISLKDKFRNLTAIFIGDMTFDECEISWINQSDMTPLLNAYPQLEHFQVRGGEQLAFSNLQHNNLKTLIVETGGLHPGTLKDVMTAKLPRLEKLELWLGSEYYGFASSVDDLQPVLSGGLFPALKHLGLMDSELQDEIAIAVCQSPILKQLDVLDLSMGTLSDKGGQALLNCTDIKRLSLLNLRHHYMSSDMMAKLKALGININMEDQEKAGEDGDRYIEVSE
jgi:hypothetical protein